MTKMMRMKKMMIGRKSMRKMMRMKKMMMGRKRMRWMTRMKKMMIGRKRMRRRMRMVRMMRMKMMGRKMRASLCDGGGVELQEARQQRLLMEVCLLL